MSRIAYTRGLHDVGNGHFVWLLPSGTWGYSNSGLVVDGDHSLLVDTLFDEKLTAEMFAAMKDAAGVGGEEIGTVVNTHANGDHTYGNALAVNATIIASERGAHEMAEEAPPEMLAAMMKNADAMGEAGAFFKEKFGAFHFDGIKLKLPDRTFTGELEVKVGNKTARLIEVGPAHTAGDTLVHVPADKVVYTGDILFIEGTPIAWAGPVSNWIKACDLICGMDVDVIVPGHGPLTDKAGVRTMRDYLVFVDKETRARHAAGMGAWEAAQDIALGAFGEWRDAERLAVTVDTIYREIDNDTSPRDVVGLFARMAQLEKKQKARCTQTGHKH